MKVYFTNKDGDADRVAWWVTNL